MMICTGNGRSVGGVCSLSQKRSEPVKAAGKTPAENSLTEPDFSANSQTTPPPSERTYQRSVA